ncbi:MULTISPECIES: FAD-dependent monooxygenase [unclassified Bradyrhizobium]|uniref:FAD-dependent monooxygenase n=1 Tax=unclassified Bradyrhizobium TaxID=2631580 RepID=UPI001FFB67FF|nr:MULTISPECIES: FAD-dependent monooxygenase [unclassified Bradyrhizobium]MCK1441774.1 FAD-dependent monooxygenase [Bradyrhizobium sp. 48]MCK1465643.1 FAD-dependent monooxygenase [Bradyrhizobium sp. 2]
MEADVVIIGAGPVGSCLAAELGRRGVKCAVVEMTDGVFKDPRLHAVSIRTMELVRKWGITDDLRNCGWPVDHPQDASYLTSLVGYELARLPWAPISKMVPPPESPTFAQRCPQSWLNPILHRYAGRFETVQFLWLHKFLGLRQDEDGVLVDVQPVEAGGAVKTIRCKYLVGCDGARSFVREQVGVEYQSSGIYGYAAEAIIESREIADLARPRMGGRYTAVTDNGVSVTLLPYDGVDRFRIVLVAEPSQVDRARMDNGIHQLVGRKVNYTYLTEVLPWINRERVAERFRAGRVFLAGDAAHTMPPAGGHGMNTGVLDGFDLGWKLAAVLQGWADDPLLDSYEFDRKKGAARTAAMAGELYADWGKIKPVIDQSLGLLNQDNAEGAAARERAGELISKTFKREYNSMGVSLGYRYSGSPVIVDDGTPEPPDDIVQLTRTARPGHRIPHAWLADGRSTLDLVGDVYTLIEIGDDTVSSAFKAAAAERLIPLVIHRIDQPELNELLGASAILVRPDQIIAWRAKGDSPTPGAVLETLTGRVLVSAHQRDGHHCKRATALA